MAEGDAVTKDPLDHGVTMIEGDPTEPTGPEDAAGHGVKRGNYAERIAEPGKQHFQMERDGDGDIVAVDQSELMDNAPGVPDAGEKGGVDSGTLEDDDTLAEAEANEVQTVTVSATSFVLNFDGEATGSLTTATTNGAEVQAALEALPNVVPGDVTVTGPDGGPYVVTFAGEYESENVPELTGVGTGGAATVTVATGTQGGS